jgi:hypothetical protein
LPNPTVWLTINLDDEDVSMQFFTAILVGRFIAAPAWASPSYTSEAIQRPTRRWRFQHLMASQQDQGVRIHGRLTANRPYSLKGHIDIAAYAPDGNLLATSTTAYIPSLLTCTAKRKGGLYFSADLAGELPPEAIVKVAFHRDQPATRLSPSLSGTIAR